MSHHRVFTRVLALVALLFAVSMCGDDETSGPAPDIRVIVSGAHALQVGDSMALSADTAGSADSSYSWSSSQSDVASVDDAGTVTGLAAGEAIIRATGNDSGARGEHVVVVSEAAPPPTPVVTIMGNPFVKVGASVALVATTQNGSDAGYAWITSDDAVATVSDGVVTGVADGTATITATGSDTGASATLTMVVATEVPHYDAWLASAHADTTAEAFVHWNEEDPEEIPQSCARCHSTPGYLDFLGADGSTAGQVDAPAPVGTVIECGACHNDAANALDAVTFPSGAVVDALGAEARCMVCHQGRSSKDDVDEAILAAAVASDDEQSQNLGFSSIHYYAAAATLNAGRVRGGYQYDSQVYDYRFRHAPGYDTCVGCHDPHSLEVKVDACNDCHDGANTLADLKDIRMLASLGQDYDGDGNLVEGIYYEIQGLKDLLYTALRRYTSEQGIGASCYSDTIYPYWFLDTNDDGSCDASEAVFANRITGWTARLIKGAYNLQLIHKDPGGFAHNGKYLIQLLHDSISDINSVLATPVDIANAVRNDFGHFNGAGEAARHWDQDDEISATCSKCHSGSEGFRFFLQYGVGKSVEEQDNGLDCATCHDNFGPNWDIVQVDAVTYPGGVLVSDPGQISNVCGVCHSGRESKATIDAHLASPGSKSFRNVHYLPASGVKEGTNAKVGYEYPNKTYAAEWDTHGRCVNCHDPVATNHTFSPHDNVACTAGCHAPTPIESIRTNHILDYDDDGSTSETLAGELQGLADALYAQIRVAAGATAICYEEHTHPYWFKDTNDDGTCQTLEATNQNRFTAWTAALIKATHNFQIHRKEPGAWAHNFDYMAQLLVDSIEDLGGDVSNFVRP